MKLNIKKSSTGSNSDVKEHHKKVTEKESNTDTQETAMEKFVKDKTEDQQKLTVQNNKTGISGFSTLGLDGSKKVSGQRAFAKKMSRMSHYITKK